jgi:hypothetical protein
MNPALARWARKLADQQSARLANVPSSRLLRATVTTVTPGGAGDGNAKVSVTWRGEVLEVADYPDSYTPVNGHRVLCALVDSQLSILHHSVGVTPTS